MKENLNYYKEGDIPGHVKKTNLETMMIIAKQMQESVCKIYGKNMNGTGFFCVIQNVKDWDSQNYYVLMTSNHVLGKQDIEPNTKIKISLNNENKNLEIVINNSRKTFSSEKYDVTIIEMKQNDGIPLDSFIEIDKDIYKDNFKEIYNKKSIYLLHYANGKEICESREILMNISEDNFTIIHCCDSENGSSGGPLINLKNNKVIGIHKGFNGKENLGSILREPIDIFYQQLKNNIKINNNTNKDKLQILNKSNNPEEQSNNQMKKDQTMNRPIAVEPKKNNPVRISPMMDIPMIGFQKMNNQEMISPMMNNPMISSSQKMNNPMANNMINPMINPMNLMLGQIENNQMMLDAMSHQMTKDLNMDLRNNLMKESNNVDIKPLTIIFKGSFDLMQRTVITMFCTPKDLASALIQKFRDKIDFREEALFIFNAKRINEALSLDENGLYDHSIIYVIKMNDVCGALNNLLIISLKKCKKNI